MKSFKQYTSPHAKPVEKQPKGEYDRKVDKYLKKKYNKEEVESIDEISDKTLTSYLTKVDADSQKHDKDPTKRPAAKRSKSVMGFSRAFNKLDSRQQKEGVAEGSNVDSQIKRIKDRILQLKDWNTAGTHDKKIKEIQARLKELQSQKQGVAEGLQQTLRKVVPGYAKREIDKKMDAGKFGRTDADKDANFQRYKKIQDKLKEQGVAEEVEQIDEISKDTLTSYRTKAKAHADKLVKDFQAGDRSVKRAVTIAKRDKGYLKAGTKLSKKRDAEIHQATQGPKKPPESAESKWKKENPNRPYWGEDVELVEELVNELSKATLASYEAGARADAEKLSKQADKAKKPETKYPKYKKATMRYAGAHKARGKIFKKEFMGEDGGGAGGAGGAGAVAAAGPTNTASGGAIASIGQPPGSKFGEPGVDLRKKKKSDPRMFSHFRRKAPKA